MNITFGICTAFEDIGRLTEMITSIRELKIPNCEIILAGSYVDNVPQYANVRYALTDGWITKKKNTIGKLATNEIIVLCHDYYVFDPSWYESYWMFGDDWDVCSNPQFLITGQRHFTDWVVWDSPIYPRYHSLDYRDWTQTKYQYVSGGYFLVKKHVLAKFPFDETLLPGSPEDVDWSLRMRNTMKIVCNPAAIVRHNKRHRDAK